jgi:hypothetical protein
MSRSQGRRVCVYLSAPLLEKVDRVGAEMTPASDTKTAASRSEVVRRLLSMALAAPATEPK